MQGKVPAPKKPMEKECVTPRGHGEGDGIRHNVTARKRVPISSARKFNARVPRDNIMVLKLEAAMAELCGDGKKENPKSTPKKCTLKSSSVAEITPTKSKPRASMTSAEDSYEIYATPRPLSDMPKKKFCRQEFNSCKVYRRLMLLAWRRARSNGNLTRELLQKQKVQISQLELQVDVLSKLRTSESQKREETQNECQKMKKSIEILELENYHLTEEVRNLQNSLEFVQNDLKMAKAENNFLSDQSIKMQDIIGKKKCEKRSLEEKVRLNEEELTVQKTLISKLEEDLKHLEKKLRSTEHNYKIKEKKYAQLKCEFKAQLDQNNSMSKQLQSLSDEKSNISIKVDDLEAQLNEYIRSCEDLRDVNFELTQEMQEIALELEEEKKLDWFKNTKQLALLSLSALQKIAYKVVPAYLDGPNF